MKTLTVLIPLASIIFLMVLARSGSGQSIHKIIDHHNYPAVLIGRKRL